MKQSMLVQLVLLGSAATVYGTVRDNRIALSQHSYGSEADCRADWGSEDTCRQPDGNGQFHGPRYYWDRNLNRPVIVEPNGTERVSATARLQSEASAHGAARAVGYARGGFGSFGRALGRGG